MLKFTFIWLMEKIFKSKGTRWRATDKIICQILVEVYKKDPVFEKVLKIIKGINGNTDKITKRLKKYIKNDSNGKPICVDFNKLEKLEGKELSGLLGDLADGFKASDIMYIGSFTAKEYTIKNIQEEYRLSRPTIEKRLPKYFVVDKRKADRGGEKIYLKPRIDILISLVVYYYLKDIDNRQNNEIVELFRLFDKFED